MTGNHDLDSLTTCCTFPRSNWNERGITMIADYITNLFNTLLDSASAIFEAIFMSS